MNDLTKQGLTTLGIVLGALGIMYGMFTIPANSDVQREFDRMEARFERMKARLESMQQATNDRFDRVDARFDGLERKMDAHFREVHKRFDRLDERVGATIQRVRGTSAVH